MVSNDKAAVTKELNEKHRKILEGLLKLPENRECADCKSRGPRWASVNLGIFVCIQCSGIHRSLGVHISKVRSATLDTWLPEQVAFIQSMGNAKANAYWEAELPPNYDRVGIENFIRAKYEEKRWISRNTKSPSLVGDEKYLSADNKSHAENVEHHSDRKNGHDSGKAHQNISKTPAVPAIPAPKRSAQVAQSASAATSSTQTVSAPQPSSSAQQSSSASSKKVESETTDLFNLLTVEEVKENGDKSSSNVDDDNSWAAFKSAETEESSKRTEQKNTSETKKNPIAALEDLFMSSATANQNQNQNQNQLPQQSQTATPAQVQTQPHLQLLQPQKDAKKDIMSLFEQSTMQSPFALHQQQMAAFLAQQQSLLMAAAAASSGKQTTVLPQQQLQSVTATKPVNGSGVTVEQPWASANHQGSAPYNIFGTQMGVQTTGQVGASVQANLSNIQRPVGQSFYNMGIPGFAMPYNLSVASNTVHATSVMTSVSGKPASSVSSNSNSSSGASYDFSSLVAGEFAKR